MVPFVGLDYAELFETYDGKAIKQAISVCLEGDKVRPAKKGEEPIGVISQQPTFIAAGGEAEMGMAWQGKYLKDEYGQVVKEEAEYWILKKRVKTDMGFVTEKSYGWSDEQEPPKGAEKRMRLREKINSEWEPTKEYVPRKDRVEWVYVGLMGQVPILKGQPVGKGWIRMKEISDKVDLYLIK